MKRFGNEHNSSGFRSNSVVDQSVGHADEIIENQSQQISPTKLSLDNLDSSMVSQGRIKTNLTLPKKTDMGNRVNNMDLLFDSVARIEGEGGFVPKVQALLKGLNKVLDSKSAEFVIFNKETRLLMLEMLPE